MHAADKGPVQPAVPSQLLLALAEFLSASADPLAELLGRWGQPARSINSVMR
jgi:hypothetical protein